MKLTGNSIGQNRSKEELNLQPSTERKSKKSNIKTRQHKRINKIIEKVKIQAKLIKKVMIMTIKMIINRILPARFNKNFKKCKMKEILK